MDVAQLLPLHDRAHRHAVVPCLRMRIHPLLLLCSTLFLARQLGNRRHGGELAGRGMLCGAPRLELDLCFGKKSEGAKRSSGEQHNDAQCYSVPEGSSRILNTRDNFVDMVGCTPCELDWECLGQTMLFERTL